jgi:DNA-binding IclR family transcriptional regulator
VSAVGVSFPLHSTANGKALLAELDVSEIRKLLPSRLPRLTPRTITSFDALLAELAEVRASGIAWDREENDVGICAVGTVIPNPFGIPTAVTVPVPASRFSGTEARLADALLAARRRVEISLGG